MKINHIKDKHQFILTQNDELLSDFLQTKDKVDVTKREVQCNTNHHSTLDLVADSKPPCVIYFLLIIKYWSVLVMDID